MFKFSTLFSVKPNENLINSSEFLPAANSNNGLIIDVRRLKDFKMGHLNKSIHIDFKKKSTFKNYFAKINKYQALYIYCNSGSTSQSALKLLTNMGFLSVYKLKGGYSNWSSCV